MARHGDVVLTQIDLEGGYTLERIINRAGEHYSLILDKDGRELYSTPSVDEQGMLDYFREVRG